MEIVSIFLRRYKFFQVTIIELIRHITAVLPRGLKKTFVWMVGTSISDKKTIFNGKGIEKIPKKAMLRKIIHTGLSVF